MLYIGGFGKLWGKRWPIWKILLLCFGIGTGFALLAVLLGLMRVLGHHG